MSEFASSQSFQRGYNLCCVEFSLFVIIDEVVLESVSIFVCLFVFTFHVVYCANVVLIML